MIRFLLLLLTVAVLSSPVWVAVLVLDPLPGVINDTSLSADDVANAKRLLKENHPKHLRDGERRHLLISEREANLLLNYALPESSAARLELSDGIASLAATVRVPANPLGSYVNMNVVFLPDDASLKPVALAVGQIRLPRWAVGAVLDLGDRLLRAREPEYRQLHDALESVAARDDALALGFRWQEGLLDRVAARGRAMVLPDAQRLRIRSYYATLAHLSRSLPEGASLADILGPLLSEARSRREAGADPAEENRALILALGMVIQGVNPEHLNVAGEDPLPSIGLLEIALRGRSDLAQHFTISAALAAAGGSNLADAIGVFKELSDSRGGSGFSFADLLADRAGVVFTEAATGPAAGQLQDRLAMQPSEALFMPPIDRLPEGLQDREFRHRYQDLDTAAYNLVRSELERRIEALPLYR